MDKYNGCGRCNGYDRYDRYNGYDRYGRHKLANEFWVLLLAWIFVIEATTFYVKSNTADNVFQAACCLAMFLFVLKKASVRPIYISHIFIYYVLLVTVSVIPDIIYTSLAGIKKSFTFLAPLILFLFLTDYYHRKETVSHKIFFIPLVYGLLVIVQGLSLEILNFAGIPVPAETIFIEKTGNEVLLSSYGHGALAGWGQAFGRDLVRIQGHYIEPSKAAAFLIIPIFLSWGFYKKYKKIRYMILTVMGMVCLIFTMSRAGMIAALGAVIVGYIIKPGKRQNGCWEGADKTGIKDIRKIFLAVFGFLIAALLMVRFMVFLSGFFPSLTFLYVGITDKAGRANLIRKETVDIGYIVNKFFERPWGYGFTGTERRWGLIQTNLANAFVSWLIMGGFFGGTIALLIIVTAMFFYGIPAFKSSDPVKRALGMIFVALTLHSLSYGTWMTADYLIMLALLCVVKGKRIV